MQNRQIKKISWVETAYFFKIKLALRMMRFFLNADFKIENKEGFYSNPSENKP